MSFGSAQMAKGEKMARYIDADRFRSAMWYSFGESDSYIERGMAKWDSGLWLRYKAVEEVLDAQPAIEIDPLRHGHWAKLEKVIKDAPYDRRWWWRCSACGQADVHSEDVNLNYCWNCGAKMDK